MRASIIFAGVVAIAFCLTSVIAESQIHMSSDVQCTGECTVTQTHNGEGVQVTSSGNIVVESTSNGKNVTMTIKSDGEGTVKLNVSKNNSAFTINGESPESNDKINSSFDGLDASSRADNSNSGYDSNRTSNTTSDCDSSQTNNVTSDYDSSWESPTNTTIEVTYDGNTETNQTDGFFQQVYHFFQGFTARIFW